jgi:hypothetical protein
VLAVGYGALGAYLHVYLVLVGAGVRGAGTVRLVPLQLAAVPAGELLGSFEVVAVQFLAKTSHAFDWHLVVGLGTLPHRTPFSVVPRAEPGPSRGLLSFAAVRFATIPVLLLVLLFWFASKP